MNYTTKQSMLDQFKISKETLDRHAQYTYGYDEESEVESSSSVSTEEYNYESIEDADERTLIQSIDSDIDNYKTGIIDAGWLTFWLKHRIEEYEKTKEEVDDTTSEPVTNKSCTMPTYNNESNTSRVIAVVGVITLLFFMCR